MNSLLTDSTVKKQLKYQRIVDRSKECMALYREDNKSEYLMEDDCIANLFECEGMRVYEKIASFCKEHNVNRIFDIGCAYGHQSEVFMLEQIEYIGVGDSKYAFWNQDKFNYIVNTYPCELPSQKGDLGVSVLCLTWNCYLYNDEITLIEQCEALKRDFEHCLLYMSPNKVEFVSKYFKNVTQLDENLHYFSNK